MQHSVETVALALAPRRLPFVALGQAVDGTAQLVEFTAGQQIGAGVIIAVRQAVDHIGNAAHLAGVELQGAHE